MILVCILNMLPVQSPIFKRERIMQTKSVLTLDDVKIIAAAAEAEAKAKEAGGSPDIPVTPLPRRR